MSISNIGSGGWADRPSLGRWVAPGLAGAALAIVMALATVLILIGSGYAEARRLAVDEARMRWVPAMADGFPFRPAREVMQNRVYHWSLVPPDRIQISGDFQLPSRAPASMSLVISAFQGEADLFVNGVPTTTPVVRDHGYLTQPRTRPREWTIPAAFLRPGPNRIDILIVEPGRRSLASPLVLGPADGPAHLYRTMTGLADGFRAVLIPLSMLAACLALVAGAVLGSSTPWVALAATATAVGARLLVSDNAVQAQLGRFGPLIDQLALAAALICLGCAIFGSRPVISMRLRRILSLGTTLLIGLAGLSAVGAYRDAPVLEAAYLLLPFLALSFLAWACCGVRTARMTRSTLGRGLDGWIAGLIALAIIAAVGVGSGLAWGLWIVGLETVYGVCLVVLLGVLAIVSAGLAVRQIWRWARDRPRLARIVRSQREQIEATALALQQQVRRATILEERQRLSRDMHDGIGGQLMTLLARVRSRKISSEQMEQELASGLSELRLMVDSLDAVEGSVGDALAVLRSRLRTQAEAAQMTLDWSQSEDLNGISGEPGWILNLHRLIQEAVTNAIRHSNGNQVRVTLDMTGDGRLTVAIADDGTGFVRDRVQCGRGLANLSFRATQMGGRLDIVSGDPVDGTVVTAIVSIAPRSLANGGLVVSPATI